MHEFHKFYDNDDDEDDDDDHHHHHHHDNNHKKKKNNNKNHKNNNNNNNIATTITRETPTAMTEARRSYFCVVNILHCFVTSTRIPGEAHLFEIDHSIATGMNLVVRNAN